VQSDYVKTVSFYTLARMCDSLQIWTGIKKRSRRLRPAAPDAKGKRSYCELAFGLPPLLVGGATFGSGGFTSFGAPPVDELDEQPVADIVSPAKNAAKSSSRMGIPQG
jgi:hypothetical protein